VSTEETRVSALTVIRVGRNPIADVSITMLLEERRVVVVLAEDAC